MLLVLTPLSPFAETFVGQAQANGSSRHIYTFSDGDIENIALYQGGADKTTKVAIPKGAEVIDVQMTLSGASSTGWSQVGTDTYEDWMEGYSNRMDSRSEDLTLGFASSEFEFASHSLDDVNQTIDTFKEVKKKLDKGIYQEMGEKGAVLS